MQYQVPQFLEIEDKIIGPLSIRQFLFIAGGVGSFYLSFKLLPVYLGIFPAAILGGLAFALAFVKINNKPFVDILQAGFLYFINTRLYVWKHIEKKSMDLDLATFARTHKHTGVAATGNNLSSLAWQIDTGDKNSVEAQSVTRIV